MLTNGALNEAWDRRFQAQGGIAGLFARQFDLKKGLVGLEDIRWVRWIIETLGYDLETLVRQGVMKSDEAKALLEALMLYLYYSDALHDVSAGAYKPQRIVSFGIRALLAQRLSFGARPEDVSQMLRSIHQRQRRVILASGRFIRRAGGEPKD